MRGRAHVAGVGRLDGRPGRAAHQHRTEVGLTPLAVSPALSAAAAWKAGHTAAYGYLAHDDPAPPVAQTFDQRIAACGYPGAFVGENIAYGQPTPHDVVDAWLASPEHRENVERPQFAATGVGAARAPSGVMYWSEEFGDVVDPLPAPPAAPPPDHPAAGRAAMSPIREARLIHGPRVLVVLRRDALVVVELRGRAPASRRARRTLGLRAGAHRVRLPAPGRLRPGRYRVTISVAGLPRRWSLALDVAATS